MQWVKMVGMENWNTEMLGSQKEGFRSIYYQVSRSRKSKNNPQKYIRVTVHEKRNTERPLITSHWGPKGPVLGHATFYTH